MASPSRPARRLASPDWLILTIACVAQFMVVLDVSIVNVALPSIGRDLHYSPTGLQWVVNAYVLTFAGFLLLGGRAADIFGRRRVYMFGLVLFSVASLVGGFAENTGWLTAARAVQGVGGAFLSPATLTIIVTTFSGDRLARSIGIWSAASGAGGAVGSILGGVLTAELSWRWVLFVNVPIGAVVLAAAAIYLTEAKRNDVRHRLDIAGAVTVTAGLGALVYAIVGTNQYAWGSTRTLSILAAAVVLLVAFAVIERRARTPLVPFKLFRSRSVTGSNIVMVLVGSAFFSMWYFLTLYMQNVLGYSALRAGLAFVPMAIMIIVGAQISSRLVPRDWRAAAPAHRHVRRDVRVRLAHPGPRQQRLLGTHLWCREPHLARARAAVHATGDRRHGGGRLRRGRVGLGCAQHVATSGRVARARGARDDRHRPHERPARVAPQRGVPVRPHVGLHPCVHGVGRHRTVRVLGLVHRPEARPQARGRPRGDRRRQARARSRARMSEAEARPAATARDSAPASRSTPLPGASVWECGVVAVVSITPRMRRLTLHAAGFDTFEYAPGQDLMFEVPGPDATTFRRRYTIRQADRGAGTLDLDLVVHGEGPGSDWAERVRPGDRISVVGPRGKIAANPDADWHLFFGDESAVPVTFAIIEALGPGTHAIARLEVEDPSEEQPHATSAGAVDLAWCYRRGAASGDAGPLLGALDELDLPTGRGHAYLNGELGVVRALRERLVERGFGPEQISMKPYWRRGVANAAHGEPERD